MSSSRAILRRPRSKDTAAADVDEGKRAGVPQSSPAWRPRVIVALCLLGISFFLWADWKVVAEYLRLSREVRTSEMAPGSAPIAPGARERQTILQHSAVDALWWLIYTEDAVREGKLRIRETKLDHYPQGREVHWSSGPIWFLAALAHVRSWSTGRSPVDEVQEAGIAFGPISLVVCLALLGALVARRYGSSLGALYALFFAASYTIYQGFRAGDVDHHGFISAAVAAHLICLLAGGLGFKKQGDPLEKMALRSARAARAWFIAAGVAGAISLWISAASTIPLLAVIGLSAALATFFACRSHLPSSTAPALWRVWGVSGAAATLFFYLLEYFPSHLGWRLEVVHPLFAFAWLGGAELLFRLCRKLSGGEFLKHTPRDVATAVAALLAVAAPLAVVAFYTKHVFWAGDPLLVKLWAQHVTEIMPIHALLMAYGSPMALVYYAGLPVLCVFYSATLLGVFQVHAIWRGILSFLLGVALLLQAQTLVQARWSVLSGPAWTVLLLAIFVICSARQTIRPIPHSLKVAAALLLALVLAAFPINPIIGIFASGEGAKQLPKEIAPTILSRDIAHRLLQADPKRLPVVLSDPTTSTTLSYFANIPTFGTLYWENLEGLRHAARLFGRRTESEAQAQLQAAGVTHLVLPSWDNLSSPARYAALLPENEAQPGQPFLQQVLDGAAEPVWLRPISYPIPTAFGLEGQWVRIYELRPQQTTVDALLAWGLFHAENGRLTTAADRLRAARKIDPGHAEAARLLQLVEAELARARR